MQQLSDKEIVAKAGSEVVVDIETYPNYFLVCVEYIACGSRVYFEGTNYNKKKLMWILENNTVITFNGIKFDIPVILFVHFKNVTLKEVYAFAQKLITGNEYYIRLMQKHGIPWAKHKIDHIDVIEVSFGQSSLKTYAGRLHAPYMQDLPYPHYTVLTEEQKKNVLHYCWNDTNNTKILFEHLEPQIKLRCEMGLNYSCDLRSKSDAQIAEAVIAKELYWKHGVEAKRSTLDETYTFKYQVPDDIKFETPQLQAVLETVRNAQFGLSKSESGQIKVDLPQELKDLKITIGQSTYKMGIGGLHSTESWMYYDEDPEWLMIDRDVASYYPAIILNQKLYPTHLTRAFLSVYKNIVDTRLAAKASGDKVTADSLKITINGSFGKFGSAYSILFAPNLLIQTTVSGQLYLLMLIERIEQGGFSVISGNTDGIVTRLRKDRKDEFDRIIKDWERDTSFDTEETKYSKYFARDVNNYVAVKPDGSAKCKGAFGKSGISKNPAGSIIYSAVSDYLSSGAEVSDTINSCTDVRSFLFVRNVKGGCIDQTGENIGKVVRWYMRKGEFLPLRYAKNGNKVPNSDGARQMMRLDLAMPQDIDYNHYIREANKILSKWFNQVEQLTLFD